jgi:hypothetical protein
MTDLTTTAQVKAYIGDEKASETLIAKMITAASAYLAQLTNRPSPFAVASYVEVYDGTGKDWLLLRQWPVVAVSAVEFLGTAIPAANTSAWPPTGGYTVEQSGQGDTGQQRLRLWGYGFPLLNGSVRVTYTAGMTSAPPDVEQACIEMVGEDYKRRSRLGIISQSVNGNETVSYSMKDVSARVASTMQTYKRHI